VTAAAAAIPRSRRRRSSSRPAGARLTWEVDRPRAAGELRWLVRAEEAGGGAR